MRLFPQFNTYLQMATFHKMDSKTGGKMDSKTGGETEHRTSTGVRVMIRLTRSK